MDYTLADLERWDERIQQKVEEFGLTCFPQEFHCCTRDQMISNSAYSGMPSRYPHWSYGKAVQKMKTLHHYGVSGLPYEMVINSDPSLAYLMVDNSLCLQILTMAHVYGHNDFFKNNHTFEHTNPETLVERSMRRAERIRDYIADPSIGSEKVERFIDAAHSLSFQCRRNLDIRKLNKDEQIDRIRRKFSPKPDEFEVLHKRQKFDEKGFREAIQRTPLEPEEDILIFIRDNNPFLDEWQRDILTTVHEEAQYFIPQAETKTMNEGWASFWHYQILNSLKLPSELHMEFIIKHNQVIRPALGQLNPYHIGFNMFRAIRMWYDGSLDKSLLEQNEIPLFEEMREDFEKRDSVPEGTGQIDGLQKIFEIRLADRDTSFFRQYLTPPLMRAFSLFKHEATQQKGKRNISEISDEKGAQKIKETLIRNTGLNAQPVIRILDANYREPRVLLLEHEYDGRELELNEAKATMRYLFRLWRGPVLLNLVFDGKEMQFRQEGPNKFTTDPEI